MSTVAPRPSSLSAATLPLPPPLANVARHSFLSPPPAPPIPAGRGGFTARRVQGRLRRPELAFALGQDGALKGSGRSIDGFHLRDALDLVSKRHPGLLVRFGGHAMAAGCTIAQVDFATFRDALQTVARGIGRGHG